MLEIITTGGTIDKCYNPISGELSFSDSYIPEIIAYANLTIDISITPLMQKDSLDMQETDRSKILQQVQHSSYDNIIITHGTDTIVETAQCLSSIKNKTIVLTGAMIPYSIAKSDASFNVGVAIASVQLLENGIYIVMNGKIFTYNQVQKNTQLGTFEYI
jgi:L-asparaginase